MSVPTSGPGGATRATKPVPLPGGFRAATGWAGLRPGGDPDVALVVADRPCQVTGMFTQSLFAGPSVTLSRRRIDEGQPRALVVVATNANVANGPAGAADAETLAALAATAAGAQADEVIVASTGVIGRRYPMPKLVEYFAGLGEEDFHADGVEVASAMMTTDTVAKTAERQVGAARIVGVAKGVGMIQPDMATMLAFVFTDAAVERSELEAAWQRAVDDTFNCLSVDTDTSTSDTAVAMASGAAGYVDGAALAVALREVCLDLTLQLARDGEGATKLLTVTVREARDEAQARRVAKAILNSPLVKTAVHGADPNWGRVAMAVGKCKDDRDIDQEKVRIAFGDLECYPNPAGSAELARLTELLKADHVEINVELFTGSAEATVYGCDLTSGYVRINADYTT